MFDLFGLKAKDELETLRVASNFKDQKIAFLESKLTTAEAKLNDVKQGADLAVERCLEMEAKLEVLSDMGKKLLDEKSKSDEWATERDDECEYWKQKCKILEERMDQAGITLETIEGS